jgi:hypothetical protein
MKYEDIATAMNLHLELKELESVDKHFRHWLTNRSDEVKVEISLKHFSDRDWTELPPALLPKHEILGLVEMRAAEIKKQLAALGVKL